MSDQEQLGRIERVELRTVWPHEAHHFTPWLAKNIDLLNEKLPFAIESTEREASAGRFSVDIVGDAIGEGGEQGKVIIENQLGQTDHDHLGKVLTYLAAYEAQSVIWIAERARPEHAKAIQWLNDKAEVDAYLFQVEAITIDDSRPAPVFTQLIGPSALSQRAKADRKRDSVRELEVRAYWSILLARVAEACRPLKAWQDVSNPKSQWASVKVPGAENAYWVLRSTKGETFVDLIVDGHSAKGNRSYLREFSDRLPPALGFKEDDKPNRRLAKMIRTYEGGWDSTEAVQHDTAGKVAKCMAKLVEATLKIATDLPSYGSLQDSP